MKKAIFLFLGFLLISFLSFAQNTPYLKPGNWKGVIYRLDGNSVPFSFNIALVKDKTIITLINAEELIIVDDFKKQSSDSLLITLPYFNASFEVATYNADQLEGYYIKTLNGKQIKASFIANWNQPRFIDYKPSKYDASGTWDVLLTNNQTNKIMQSVGTFKQNVEGKVTGSFLTPTGDYRFLEGLVSGDTLKLSAFDGERVIYFEGRFINSTSIIEGKLIAGFGGSSKWEAKANPTAKLPNEYDYSKMRPGNTKLDFKFKDLDGKIVSLTDDEFKNKVVVIQLFGSWCPNCMDETRFITDYYKKNRSRGVEVIALAYERYDNPLEANFALKKYKKQFGIQYPILDTGVEPSDPFKAEKSLPQIDKIAGYPSTIFIDRKGEVRKIHTGFSGPATGQFYTQYISNFNKYMDELIAEKLN